VMRIKMPNPLCMGQDIMQCTSRSIDAFPFDWMNPQKFYHLMIIYLQLILLLIFGGLVPSIAIYMKMRAYVKKQADRCKAIKLHKPNPKCQSVCCCTACQKEVGNQCIQDVCYGKITQDFRSMENSDDMNQTRVGCMHVNATGPGVATNVEAGKGSGGSFHQSMHSELACVGLGEYADMIARAELEWSELQEIAATHPGFVSECLKEAGIHSIGHRLRIVILLKQ